MTARPRSTAALLMRSGAFLTGIAILSLWVVCALFGPAIAPQDPYRDDLLNTLMPPSAEHWFGTDQIGRDIFSRVIVGARPILATAPLATLIATALGTALGLMTGYLGGLVDLAIGRLIEVMLALPLIIVALVALVALGPSSGTVIAVIGLVFTPLIARTVRSAVLAERALDYVAAAELRGEGTLHIMFVEILPNVLPAVLVETTVRLGYAIFTVASLSFLGFGIQPPSADWGLAIAENYSMITGGFWWTAAFAAGATASLVVAVNLVADGIAGRAAVSIPALEVRDLDVRYRVRGAELAVLRGVSLTIRKGESYGLVGESGCGKSTVALAVLRALPRNGRLAGGSVRVAGQDVTGLSAPGLRQLRARSVSMVYQDAGRALNPSLTVGRQLTEAYGVLGTHGDAARAAAERMLGRVRIPGARRVMAAYPHQLSGGMQQRVVIAMALAKDPALLVLDEPTTGLDATVEAEVLDLVATLREELDTALLFISHNLGIIRQMCDRVGVLYAGTLVEEGGATGLLRQPIHPYTVQLLRCLPVAGRSKSDTRLDTIAGTLPAPGPLPPGCTFAPRCVLATELCRTTPPPLVKRPSPSGRGLGEGAGHACEAVRRLHPHPGPLPEGEGEGGGHTAEGEGGEHTAEGEGGGHSALCHHPDEPVPLQGDGARRLARRVGLGRAALRAVAVSKTFGAGPNRVRAVSDVSLDLPAGQTLGLVGESGSGKTTLARLLLGLIPPDPGGTVELDGKPVAATARQRSRADRKALQVVFQNPDSALNRAHTVRHLIARALSQLAGLRGAALQARLDMLVDAVRLTARQLPMRPRQLSGGLKQRVAIARAFAGEPRVVICDEPTSALDVSVQASILNLLVDLQEREAVSYVFISHDLGVVRYISDRIAVLYLGRIMEIGPAEAVFEGPHHPYTEALLSAVPGFPGPRVRLAGEMPSPLAPPPGCAFSSRCPRKLGPVCDQEEPGLDAPGLDDQPGHAIRCHIPRHELGRRVPAEPAWSTS